MSAYKSTEEKRLYEARLDRDVERIMAQAPRCPIHGSHHVAGVGIGGKLFCYGTGICPSCFWEYWKVGLVRSATLADTKQT